MGAFIDLLIEQGATFAEEFLLVDENDDAIDLTDYTARATIRDAIGGNELVALTTENGGISITPATGSIVLRISSGDTTALTFTNGVYDLEVVDIGGDVTRVSSGAVTVSAEVTT